MQALGLQVTMPELQPDAFPVLGPCMTVLSVVHDLNDPKAPLKLAAVQIVNVISVVIFARQGVYAMSLEYPLLTFIALERQPDVEELARVSEVPHAFSG